MHRAGIDRALRHGGSGRRALVQILLRIRGKLGAAAGATEMIVDAVIAEVMRRLRRIDVHAADRIGRDARVMVVRAVAVLMIRVVQGEPLEIYTLWGYIERMQANAKTSVTKRLKRIEGQVRGLVRMVEDDRYCIDIVTQLSAVRAALRRAEEEILADHVAHCVEHAIASGNKTEQRRKVAELTDVLRRVER
jgi:CsoR family transcriptional regulator, copper-sensing transcriptional repressor